MSKVKDEKIGNELDVNEGVGTTKKVLIRNNTLFALILILGLIVSAIIFGVNFAKSRINDNSNGEQLATQSWQKIADNISNMVLSADLQITYINSDKRTVLYLIGSKAYYGVQYSNNKIYVSEGTYTNSAVTDEQKISEANSNITGNLKIYAEDIASFTVENFNAGTNTFSDGTVQIRFRVDMDGGNYHQDTLTAAIPQ